MDKTVIDIKSNDYGGNTYPLVTITKQWELLKIRYTFDKSTRKLINEPKWRHYKSYRTEDAAKDAITAKRHDLLDFLYRNYPGDENKFPHIRPVITIWRYKYVKNG